MITNRTPTTLTFKAINSEEERSAEAQLLSRCLSDDHRAQASIYEAYYKAMYNTALRFVSDVFEAEDIMQEAFITAFQNLHKLEKLETFGGWLKQIVINKSINRLKQQASFQELKDEWGQTSETEAVEFDASVSVEEIKSAINQLPTGFKSILNLYLFEGYDHEEIGEILQISSATSRSQYNRGKKRLKELLTI